MTYPKYTVQDNAFLADIADGHVFHKAVFSETVADNGSLLLFLQTNNADRDKPHSARFRVSAGGLAKFNLYESASVEAGQSGLAWSNYNRASPKTTVATLSTVTSFSNGSLIWEYMFGTGATGGGGDTDSQEFILADSAHYVFELVNINGNAQAGFLAIDYVDRGTG